MPNRSASYTGFISAFISISQALQEPVSTSRIASERRKGLLFSTAAVSGGICAGTDSAYRPVTTPVFRLFFRMRNILHSQVMGERRWAMGGICYRPIYRSFPAYDRLKLLLINGKSGTIFPRTAHWIAGQFTNEGSRTLHR